MTIPDSMYYSAHYSYLVTPFVPGVDAVFRALEFIVKSNGHTVEATATVWEFDGWADPVVWYAGSETPSTISARFSGGMSRLSKVVWTGPAPSGQEVFSEEPEDETVFYTVPIGVAMCWKPGDQIIYRCAGTNERGETASVSVKIMVLEGTGPQTSASADGPWTDLDGRDWGQLRMDPLFAENGNQYYRCVVTNGDTGDSAYSNPYMVSAWSKAATPLVLGNPESQTFPILPENGGTTPGNTIALQSAAVLGSGVQTPEAQ